MMLAMFFFGKQVPLFLGKIPIERGTMHTFAVIVRPQIYYYKTTPEGGTIISDENRNVRLEIPAGAFKQETQIKCQVFSKSHVPICSFSFTRNWDIIFTKEK